MYLIPASSQAFFFETQFNGLPNHARKWKLLSVRALQLYLCSLYSSLHYQANSNLSERGTLHSCSINHLQTLHLRCLPPQALQTPICLYNYSYPMYIFCQILPAWNRIFSILGQNILQTICQTCHAFCL